MDRIRFVLAVAASFAVLAVAVSLVLRESAGEGVVLEQVPGLSASTSGASGRGAEKLHLGGESRTSRQRLDVPFDAGSDAGSISILAVSAATGEALDECALEVYQSLEAWTEEGDAVEGELLAEWVQREGGGDPPPIVLPPEAVQGHRLMARAAAAGYLDARLELTGQEAGVVRLPVSGERELRLTCRTPAGAPVSSARAVVVADPWTLSDLGRVGAGGEIGTVGRIYEAEGGGIVRIAGLPSDRAHYVFVGSREGLISVGPIRIEPHVDSIDIELEYASAARLEFCDSDGVALDATDDLPRSGTQLVWQHEDAELLPTGGDWSFVPLVLCGVTPEELDVDSEASRCFVVVDSDGLGSHEMSFAGRWSRYEFGAVRFSTAPIGQGIPVYAAVPKRYSFEARTYRVRLVGGAGDGFGVEALDAAWMRLESEEGSTLISLGRERWREVSGGAVEQVVRGRDLGGGTFAAQLRLDSSGRAGLAGTCVVEDGGREGLVAFDLASSCKVTSAVSEEMYEFCRTWQVTIRDGRRGLIVNVLQSEPEVTLPLLPAGELIVERMGRFGKGHFQGEADVEDHFSRFPEGLVRGDAQRVSVQPGAEAVIAPIVVDSGEAR